MVDLKTKILTIERPLIPPPPIDSKPQWYYANTLGFFKNGEKVWEQEIPEAKLLWKPLYKHEDGKWVYWRDEFDNYFRCEAFKDKNFGWQLRMTISHNYANIWHKKMMNYIKRYHRKHFKKEKEREKNGRKIFNNRRSTRNANQ